MLSPSYHRHYNAIIEQAARKPGTWVCNHVNYRGIKVSLEIPT